MFVVRCGLLALLLPLLVGCPALDRIRHGGTPALSTEEQSSAIQAAEVLAYMRYVNDLHKTGSSRRVALRSELDLMEQQVQEHQRLADRAKLAWLLTLPGSGFQDAGRGLDSLRDIAEVAGEGAVADLTRLVVTTVGKRIDLSHKLRNANVRYRSERGQQREMEEKIDSLEEKIADLQYKINALTHLETDIDPSNHPR